MKAHSLDSPSLNSTTMVDQINRSTTLGSVLARLEKLQKRVSDRTVPSRKTARGRWRCSVYAMLQRRATTDGTLSASLEPVNAFFNYRHDSVTTDRPAKLQTRANAKLRDAQRLVARTKPRASVIEEENEAHASAPSPAPVAAQPQPQPIVIVQLNLLRRLRRSLQPVVAQPSVTIGSRRRRLRRTVRATVFRTARATGT